MKCKEGPVYPKLRKLFGPVKTKQNIEPYDYRAVSFTYSSYEEKFPSHKTFQAYTLIMALRARNLTGLSRNGPQEPVSA